LYGICFHIQCTLPCTHCCVPRWCISIYVSVVLHTLSQRKMLCVADSAKHFEDDVTPDNFPVEMTPDQLAEEQKVCALFGCFISLGHERLVDMSASWTRAPLGHERLLDMSASWTDATVHSRLYVCILMRHVMMMICIFSTGQFS
jgi:hypothetical protein